MQSQETKYIYTHFPKKKKKKHSYPLNNEVESTKLSPHYTYKYTTIQ